MVNVENAGLQRKLHQLQTQLADAETRAASHLVILQQHQQRKDMQEKKATALQSKLHELQAQAEASLVAAQEEMEDRMASLSQEADRRSNFHSCVVMPGGSCKKQGFQSFSECSKLTS